MESTPSTPADVASTGTVTPTGVVDWEFRQGTVRHDEWQLYCKGLKVVQDALDRLIENPPATVTLPQVARLLEIVNKIGRIASGLGYDTVEQRVPENAEFMIEVDTILERVFTIPSEGRDGTPPPSACSVLGSRPSTLDASSESTTHEQN